MPLSSPHLTCGSSKGYKLRQPIPLDPDAESALPLLPSPTQLKISAQEATFRCGELLITGQAGDRASPVGMQLRVSPSRAAHGQHSPICYILDLREAAAGTSAAMHHRIMILRVFAQQDDCLIRELPGDLRSELRDCALQEIFRECCGFSCYMACWRPDLAWKTKATNLADFAEPCNGQDSVFYRKLLVRPALRLCRLCASASPVHC